MRRIGLLGPLAAIVSAACAGERVVTAPPTQSGLVVHVTPEQRLAAAAASLSWPPGTIPGAIVVVQAIASSAGASVPDTARVDSVGVARFANLPSGRYSVRVTRDLTEDERARAASALDGAYALEGFGTVTVEAPKPATLDLQARGVQRGSLVISEIYPTAVRIGPSGEYWTFGNYVEIFNNTDTIIALAGKLFFEAFTASSDSPTYPCSMFANLMDDPSGLWASLIYKFPDAAPPLPPGRSAIVATDAIDHRQFGKGIGFFDLSSADFEFRGSSDADNPAALDMISVGTRDVPFGHGWFGAQLRNVVALSMPLRIDSLPSKFDPNYAGGSNWVQMPTGAILDVLQWRTTYETTYPPCRSSVYSDIDAGETRVISPEDSIAMHRRVRYRLPDGRPVLQKSRNSAADFMAAPGTPGVVP